MSNQINVAGLSFSEEEIKALKANAGEVQGQTFTKGQSQWRGDTPRIGSYQMVDRPNIAGAGGYVTRPNIDKANADAAKKRLAEVKAEEARKAQQKTLQPESLRRDLEAIRRQLKRAEARIKKLEGDSPNA